ncbi:MAG: hypothetical protein BGO98_37855 [Myxococcales bacterium 68-20]|nr:MAG: hypothetical protein BGO98_37855 [Myxococcales bacterium 68-20]
MSFLRSTSQGNLDEGHVADGNVHVVTGHIATDSASSAASRLASWSTNDTGGPASTTAAMSLCSVTHAVAAMAAATTEPTATRNNLMVRNSELCWVECARRQSREKARPDRVHRSDVDV